MQVASLLLSMLAVQATLTDSEGRQAIHIAALNGHQDLVTMLLSQGIHIDVADNVSLLIIHNSLPPVHNQRCISKWCTVNPCSPKIIF